VTALQSEYRIANAGFELHGSVFREDEIQAVLDHLVNLKFHQRRAGIRHLMSDATVREIANDNRLTELARSATGAAVFPFRATLFDKSVAANWLVVWHQDTALPLRERTEDRQWGPWSVKDGIAYAHAPAWALEQVIALRLHLDDSDPENGPLRVLPGTHLSGVLSDDAIEKIAASTIPVECTVEKGGVVVMRPLAVHASSKVVSLKPRRVLHIEYAARRLEQEVRLAIA
jgi:hypothetical protein